LISPLDCRVSDVKTTVCKIVVEPLNRYRFGRRMCLAESFRGSVLLPDRLDWSSRRIEHLGRVEEKEEGEISWFSLVSGSVECGGSTWPEAPRVRPVNNSSDYNITNIYTRRKDYIIMMTFFPVRSCTIQKCIYCRWYSSITHVRLQSLVKSPTLSRLKPPGCKNVFSTA
jgi:hypothetical protein